VAGLFDRFSAGLPFGKRKARSVKPKAARKGVVKGRSVKKAAAKKSVANKSSAKGATRKSSVVVERPGRWSAWVNRFLILLGAGVVIAAAAKAYVTVESIPVQRISVTGELEHTQAEAVQGLVQPSLAGGFLKADLHRMRAELEGLPWIFEATVRRKWPNALEIHVVEQLPIARWGEDGFLNHEGGVFHSDKDGNWESLPLLSGPEGSAQKLMARYQRLMEILAPVNLTVSRLVMDERGQVEASLAGGVQLMLGSADFLGRMHRFVAIYRSELAPRLEEIDSVDLRYETGLAVAYSEISTVAGL
jgi:cell division protein FtsQ